MDRLSTVALLASVAACAAPEGEPELTARMIDGVATDEDRSGDLRPAARAILEARDQIRGRVATVPGVPLAGEVLLPDTIRIWRRGLDGSSDSCSGRVDEIPFEDYVKGVLPHEWIPSWEPAALEAGAVAVRTYAAAWAASGGKYDCADLDDTTASQVYDGERDPATDAAVDATAGIILVEGDSIVFAEYSAENGDPTAFGVDEPHCAGEEVRGHGRGTCQWGTQRWALNEGRSYAWIATHYYPGAELIVASPDGVEPPEPDPDPSPGSDPEPMSRPGHLGGGCAAGGGGGPAGLLLLGALLVGLGRRR